jgi:hypothetical protein
MVIYSVTINVHPEIADDWVRWMKHVHIPDVMATGCFKAYGFHRLVDPPTDDGTLTFNVQYACPSYEVLEEYRREHAPALQAETTRRYEGKFIAFRTILTEV